MSGCCSIFDQIWSAIVSTVSTKKFCIMDMSYASASRASFTKPYRSFNALVCFDSNGDDAGADGWGVDNGRGRVTRRLAGCPPLVAVAAAPDPLTVAGCA
jgi:hypothetical protein